MGIPRDRATSNEELNRRVFADAEARGLLCNVADVPELCSFILPAVHREGPIAVAVSTGARPRWRSSCGAGSPRRSGEGGLVADGAGPGLGEADVPHYEERRDFFQREVEVAQVTVSLVGAGPGDPGLITVRGLERVRACEVLVYDRLVARELVAEAPGSAIRIARDRRTQEAVNALLVAHGSRAARSSASRAATPSSSGAAGRRPSPRRSRRFVRDRARRLVARRVPAAAGIPVTHRGVSGSVTAVAAHDPGGSTSPRSRRWAAPSSLHGPRARARVADGLAGHGLDPATPAAVVASGTTEAQQVVTAPLARIAASAAGLESPALVVVGEAVSLADRLTPLRPAAPATRRRPPRSRRAAAAPRPAPASSARHR